MSDARELTVPPKQSANLLAQVIAAAKDPTIDAAKMETLARLVNSQQDREREIEFNQSKNAAMQEMPVITKDGKIIIRKQGSPDRLQGRYARFEDIDRVVRPILQRHNLAISFEPGDREAGGITVRAILSHANGFTERGDAMPLPYDQSGGKQPVQAVGSSLQYGKRYTMCAMLNIVTEGVDDDGLGGMEQVSLPHEREQLVLQEANAAHEAGRYLEWYGEQSPKDRGWLVQSGNHERLGGQVAIAAPRKEPAPEPTPTPTPTPAAETTSGVGKRTPPQMVADFKKTLEGATTTKQLIDMQAEPKILQWLDRLGQTYPDLHKEVGDYAAKLYSALAAKEREGRS